MQIRIEGLGKKFNKTWIFKDVSHHFCADRAYAILGANGSGKSTLMQVIACFLTPSTGRVSFHEKEVEIPVEEVYKKLAISTPYMELIEEFTLIEMLDFHCVLKPFRAGLTAQAVVDITGLNQSSEKQIKNFSSGMKQRVRLAIALLSDVPVVFLDEPLTNLDEQGIKWYKDLVRQHRKDRTIIVCSNHVQDEYGFCEEVIDLMQYKQVVS